jgi:hypothetical protein
VRWEEASLTAVTCYTQITSAPSPQGLSRAEPPPAFHKRPGITSCEMRVGRGIATTSLFVHATIFWSTQCSVRLVYKYRWKRRHSLHVCTRAHRPSILVRQSITLTPPNQERQPNRDNVRGLTQNTLPRWPPGTQPRFLYHLLSGY